MTKFQVGVVILFHILINFSCTQKNVKEGFILPTNSRNGSINHFKKVCFFASSQKEIDSLRKVSKIDIEVPTNREIEQVRQITDFIGLPQNFGIYKGNVRNALATVVEGNRIIILAKTS